MMLTMMILHSESWVNWHHLNLSRENLRLRNHAQGLTLPQDISYCGQLSDHRANNIDSFNLLFQY